MAGGRESVFMLDLTEDKEGPSIHVVTPASVLRVQDADELRGMLEAYEDPIKNKVVKNTAKDRRHYVEKILPALRWYCEKLGVDAPEWLVSTNHWTSMDKAEQERLFGGELLLREFQPVNCPDIQVQREEEEEAVQ